MSYFHQSQDPNRLVLHHSLFRISNLLLFIMAKPGDKLKRGLDDVDTDGNDEQKNPASKRKRGPLASSNTSIPPPPLVKANIDVSNTYISFGTIPPSPEAMEKLDGLINDVPVAALVDPNVAQLFDTVAVRHGSRVPITITSIKSLARLVREGLLARLVNSRACSSVREQ